MAIQPVGAGSWDTFVQQALDARAPAASTVMGGLLLDSSDRIVLWGDFKPQALLSGLSQWVRSHVRHRPAIRALVGARAGHVPVDADNIGVVSLAGVDWVEPAGLWAELEQADAAGTARALAALQPGQRVWYWIRGGEDSTVIITDSETDPSMKALRRRVDAATGGRASSAAACSGSGSVLSDGRLQLLGTALSLALLVDVAGWVEAHVDSHPGLARLRDVSLVNLGADRAVVSVLSAPDQWVLVPSPRCPGTLASSRGTLAAMASGDNAWYWATRRGEGGQPFVGVHRFEGELTPAVFQAQVRRYRRRFPAARDRLFGVVRRQPSGGLLYTTSDSGNVARLASILGTLEPPLSPSPARIAVIRSQRLVKALALPSSGSAS